MARLFGTPLRDRILQLSTSACQSGDTLVWGDSCLPIAPVRDLSRLLHPRPPTRLDAAWIWKLRAHPRVRLFIWKFAWDRLPTCSLLHHRGVLLSSLCPICGVEEETSDHAVLVCPRARWTWQSLGFCPWERGNVPWRLAFLDCIRQDATGGPGGLGGQMVLYTAYMIWSTRNHFIFANEVTPCPRLLRRVHFLASEFIRSDAPRYLPPGFWDSHAASAAIRRTVFISWESPPPGFMKINFDGSVRGPVGGAGFVIRDQGGRLMAAGGSRLTEVSVPRAELHAAWAGTLCAIRDLGATRIVIEGDSMTVIDWIRQGALWNPLLRDIGRITSSLDAVVVRHVYREANCAADWTATFVALHSHSWFCRPGDTRPQGLQAILFSDSLGYRMAL